MNNQARPLLLILLFGISLAGFTIPTSAATSRHFEFEQNSAATGNGCQGQSNCFNSSSPVPPISVNQGDTISITVHNNDTTVHTFTMTTAPYTGVDTGNMNPGQTKTLPSFTASTAETVHYQCNIHPTTMLGTFVVIKAAPTLTPAGLLALLSTITAAVFITVRKRR